jgi:hypothetical protein
MHKTKGKYVPPTEHCELCTSFLVLDPVFLGTIDCSFKADYFDRLPNRTQNVAEMNIQPPLLMLGLCKIAREKFLGP